MSKKSINTQWLVLLFSLSCVAFAGPKKKFVCAQSEETVKQAQGQSSSSKKRASSVSRQKESSRQESIVNLDREEVASQQPAPSIQQNTGDQVQEQGVPPALEQVVQEQSIVPVLQNAGEIKEQAGEKQETAAAQFFNIRYLVRIMTSFLGPKDFVNFAYTNKKIYNQLLDMRSLNTFDSARARFAQDGFSSFFDLEKTIGKERIVEFLSAPSEKPLLRRCLGDGKLCISLYKETIQFLNTKLPHWKQALVDLRAPIVVCDEMGFDLLKASQIIAGEITFGWAREEHFIEKNALLPLIQEKNILLSLDMATVYTRQEVTKSIEDLFNKKQVVNAALRPAVLTEPFLDLSSLRHLDLRVNDRSQFYALAESLATRSPNLEHLKIYSDRVGILGAKGVPVLSLKWEKLKSLDMGPYGSSWKFQSYKEFQSFYRAMSRGLTAISLPHYLKFNCKQLSEFVEYFPALSKLDCEIRVDLKGNLSLGQWMIKSLEKNQHLTQNLTALKLEICHRDLTEQKDLEIQNKAVLLPHINDLHVKLCIDSFGSRVIELFSAHMMGILPLLDMHADSKNQMGNKKTISILGFNLEYTWGSDALNKQISYLAKMIQNSGSHVEFRFSENTAFCLKKSELLSEQDKKRIVF